MELFFNAAARAQAHRRADMAEAVGVAYGGKDLGKFIKRLRDS